MAVLRLLCELQVLDAEYATAEAVTDIDNWRALAKSLHINTTQASEPLQLDKVTVAGYQREITENGFFHMPADLLAWPVNVSVMVRSCLLHGG